MCITSIETKSILHDNEVYNKNGLYSFEEV